MLSRTPSPTNTRPCDVLTLSELRQVAGQFGVDDLQVRRDHLISHLLAAISNLADTSVIFFGGTALARSQRTLATHEPAPLRRHPDEERTRRSHRLRR
jgi:hypothetical protein